MIILLLEKQKIRIDFAKVPWVPESLSGSVVWWWSYTCTNLYAVYGLGSSLSVTYSYNLVAVTIGTLIDVSGLEILLGQQMTMSSRSPNP